MVDEQRDANHTTQEQLRRLRFSLRRLLVRFCGDTGIFPETLSRRDFVFPTSVRPYGGGAFGDVYCVGDHPNRLAFKTFRVLKHKNIETSDEMSEEMPQETSRITQNRVSTSQLYSRVALMMQIIINVGLVT